ncbi:MAG: phosphoribosylamine--glycine ligase [Gammaproteobacteria bacterium]
MNILLIGSGGREHAIAWKLQQSPIVENIYVAPGNAGTALEHKCKNIPIEALDLKRLGEFAQQENVQLVIVGPEDPLVMGIRDHFDALNIKCFGPSAKSAQLEGSKAFAKDFMSKYKIPTAQYGTFNELNDAVNYVKKSSFPLVIKADGLAAGKGVLICQNEAEALNALDEILEDKRFGSAGNQVVIEEFLEGEELSFIAIVVKNKIFPLASSQDHKRRDDNDMGPNTGGMGAYSPSPLLDDDLNKRIMEKIMEPTALGLIEEKAEFHGFLYAGLMIDKQGEPKVLEFNCRMGDPETQPILMRLESDLAEILMSTFEENPEPVIHWNPETALGVVMATKNYPYDYPKGQPISGLDKTSDESKVFHAGTKLIDNVVEAHGGRVLCVTSLGANLKEAQTKAYEETQKIKWQDCFFRRDIGSKGLKH